MLRNTRQRLHKSKLELISLKLQLKSRKLRLKLKTLLNRLLHIRRMLPSKLLSRLSKKSLPNLKRKRPQLRLLSAIRKLQQRLLKKRSRSLLRNLQRHTLLRNKQLQSLPRKLKNPVESVQVLKNHLLREIVQLPRKRESKQSLKLFLMEVKLQQRQIIS